ncbi:beta-glucosidase-like glycosyl hydrolase [Actinoplanes lutulentus]|uniref:Beta-glucosidase-like glycosyl hydrolase n=1 Tax=Actinoplanes lutulentus TaxID=1287878 RepID=A0A327ZGB7_9ACTN|nr:glycoside hydrolase family 3 C-terminal domain-containing protein [Actinoplanes lutulentus]MBB2947289.1 beta-glucosidase-like glycosyl hydrolase [Actinoplanes lutulentus]RAK36564.1 beta-glucosidase-like glycosyl hydrolase [Actinoplanes lutulentus]
MARLRTRAAVVIAGLLAAGITPVTPAHAATPADPIYLDTRYTFAERAADLVSRMTLAEKVAQLRTNTAPPIARLGVQQYTYWNEAQHGVNRLGGNARRGSVSGGVHATSFPTNLATSMSWDPELIYQETTAIADEARGLLDKSLWNTGQNNIGPDRSAYGNLSYWAPTVNMARDPRWGRNDEGFGEDPLLVSTLAGAYVNGFQGQSRTGERLTPYLKTAATAKHFALNNVEANRESGSSDTTEANIRNYYTPQFRSLIQDAHVSGLMTAYNRVNGTPAPADTYMTNVLAERTFGFGGYSTSDCGAITDIWAPNRHNWAPPGWTTATADGRTTWTETGTGRKISGAAGAQAWALRAGTQLNCRGDEYTLANVQEALDVGVLSEGVLDDALVRVFTTRMATGEFDPADQVSYTAITKDQIESPAHQRLAEQVAANSLVLLKNDPVDGAAVLPADPDSLDRVIVVGNLANTVTLGGYSGDPTVQVNAVQGIRNALPQATVSFDACATSTTAAAPAACDPQTLADLPSADLVVVFVGTDQNVATEGKDRATLALPGNYQSLIDQVSAAGNPRSVLAVQASGPVAIEQAQRTFPAVVFGAYNGQSQGTALASVLFGAHNPSGRLSFTWQKDDSQLPDIQNYGLTPAQTGGLGRTYQYFTGTPSYPFGHGLSYTTFAYGKVRADRSSTTPDGRVTVHVDVTNTGTRAGATVAQVYATMPEVAGLDLPAKRLAGFQKTRILQPGERQAIAVRIPASDLAFYDEKQRKQVVYNGRYQFQVATDAAHVVGSDTVRIHGRITPRISSVSVQPDRVQLTPGDRVDLDARNPWIADDTTQAGQHVRADRVVEAVYNDESFADLQRARVTYRSSNPRVATVNQRGRITAISAGVTTIAVTVGGVTGTTPIVVKQPFSLDAPALAEAGSSLTATVTLPNPGPVALTGVTLTLGTPDGWTATPDGPTTFTSVAPGQTVRASWTVTAPDKPGIAELTAAATFRSVNGPATTSATRTVSLPFPSLASAYGNVGISDDAQPAAGNIDGGGYSYSAQALAAATPAIVPGGAVTHDGLTFTWPAAGAGSPDNVVAGGQTIALQGSGTKLGLIGAGVSGTASGPATVTYTDGTTQSFTLAFTDWYANNPAPGGAIVTSLAYHNTVSNPRVRKVSLYSTSTALDPAKTVRYLTLPNISQGVSAAQTSMHIFATAIG